MGKQYSALNDSLMTFIARQKLFFVATAVANGRVNLSPKGMDSLRVVGDDRVVWLNVTGSGNETAAHVQVDPRMTIMFCAFEGDPMILRLYGNAKVIHPRDPEWETLSARLPPLPGARQIFDLTIDLVQSSCGMAVPLFDYVEDRDQLNAWAEKKGDAAVRQYWRDKNRTSLDGLPTHIEEKDG